MCRLLPYDLEAIVVSYGGVGTTFLIKHLSKYKKINDALDKDGFKHLPIQPVSFNRNIRFVYLYGDPVIAVQSLFRRKLHQWHIVTLNRHKREKGTFITEKTTLEQYAAAGTDSLGIMDHFFNWHRKYQLYPILFMRYEKIWENVEILYKFLDIPVRHAKNFPKKMERKSKTENLLKDTKERLDKIYSPLATATNDMGDFEFYEPKNKNGILRILLSENFRAAVKGEVQNFITNFHLKLINNGWLSN